MEKYWIYSSLHVIFFKIMFIRWLSNGTFQQTSTSVILILCNSEIYWSFFYSLWREKNQNIKVMHYSAALSVFKSTHTTYLLDQHFPPFEFVIKSSILIVWGFLVLGVVRFQQKKNEDRLWNSLPAAHEGLRKNILQQRGEPHWWTDPWAGV